MRASVQRNPFPGGPGQRLVILTPIPQTLLYLTATYFQRMVVGGTWREFIEKETTCA